ncbi:MAG: disulfide bond formation protein B [Alphaproteobacteria bacterium]|nr:disulfide bond formation protein B [Alphaproteobacteria bacterium]
MDRTIIVETVQNILTTPKYMGLGIAGISAMALIMALISQYVFGLLPCILCLYQRWPYAIAIVLGILMLLLLNKGLKTSSFILLITSITFFVNSGIAFFHSGVERHWWEGLKGCSAPDMSGSVEELMERIKNAPQAKCDEIPWADPILGGSMANYNVIFCFGLGVVCLLSSVLVVRKSNGY